MNSPRVTRPACALLSGCALAFAFPSYDVPILGWVSVAGLMLASLGTRAREALLCGFLYGAAFYCTTLPWIYTVMRVHGHLEPAAALGVLAAMVAVLALFTAAFAWCLTFVGRRSMTLACCAAPFFWVALELGRTHLPDLGFPWNLLGYTAASSLVLVQLTSLTGIYGLSFFVAAYNALLVWAVKSGTRSNRRPYAVLVGVTVVLVLVAALGPRIVPEAAPTQVARLVQTNFPQSTSYPSNWLEVHAGELDELERISLAPRVEQPALLIWPEVPAPFSLQDPSFAERAQRLARAWGGEFLLGVVDWKRQPNGRREPYNSVALLSGDGSQLFLYDKIHLVPFGEYVPFRRWLTFAGKLTADIGDFRTGTEYKVAPVFAGGAGVFICYEAIFPNEVRRFVLNGAAVLVNLSNDGWFLGSAAPAQHLAQARVRAVENRRWLLRGTNTGMTVSIDPYGRMRAELATNVRGALDAPYGLRGDRTFYSRYGDWLAWVCVAGSVLFLAVAVVRRRTETE